MNSEDALASVIDAASARRSSSRSTCESAEEGQPREEGVTIREDGSVYGWRRALGTRAGRVRARVAFTLMRAPGDVGGDHAGRRAGRRWGRGADDEDAGTASAGAGAGRRTNLNWAASRAVEAPSCARRTRPDTFPD